MNNGAASPEGAVYHSDGCKAIVENVMDKQFDSHNTMGYTHRYDIPPLQGWLLH